MKKVFILFISLLLLTSCFGKNKGVVNNKDTDEEEIIYINNYDGIKTDVFKPYKENIEPNNAWILEGSGSFKSDKNKKTIVIEANSEVS